LARQRDPSEHWRVSVLQAYQHSMILKNGDYMLLE
jgi:hypothetical protein